MSWGSVWWWRHTYQVQVSCCRSVCLSSTQASSQASHLVSVGCVSRSLSEFSNIAPRSLSLLCHISARGTCRNIGDWVSIRAACRYGMQGQNVTFTTDLSHPQLVSAALLRGPVFRIFCSHCPFSLLSLRLRLLHLCLPSHLVLTHHSSSMLESAVLLCHAVSGANTGISP